MKYLSCCFLILVILRSYFPLFSQEEDIISNPYHYLENPSVFAVNQLDGHTPLLPYSSVEQARQFNPDLSEGFISLNGFWKFTWSENPALSPKDFFKTDYDDSGWDTLQVPSNWEMHGYGDPMFRNISQPFISDPPRIPHDYNPVGSYRKTFILPGKWDGKAIFLRMEGASSASFVWVNGKPVGYNQGANEPAEYDITGFVKPGKNLVAINVYKYSDGTYLEDQDFWRLSGIFRDVSITARSNVHIRDYYVVTDFDSLYRDAELSLMAEVANDSREKHSNWMLRVNLKTDVTDGQAFELNSRKISLDPGQKLRVNLSTLVRNPEKWSDEKPSLYSMTIELIDNDNNVVEVVSGRIGFREVEIKHQVLLVNGVPVKLNGVNSHMQHPELGHTMDRETIIRDFTLMKQFNINCVRTSHYPPVKEYLDLADEMGIWVVDETGDEAHATEFLSERPEWKEAYLDRVRGMVLRDRNHPCVIFWSAGNESGIGNNICEVIREGKTLDPSRVFMYGGNTDDAAWKNEVPCEDIIGPRYPTPYELKTRIARVPESTDPRPSFMDEYISVQGNGCGGLDEYWEVIYHYPRCSGGALWDYVSPGITEKIRLLTDESPNRIQSAIKGRGLLVAGKSGKAVELSGYDQWVDVYRDPALDITGNSLSLSVWLYPRPWNTDGTFISKGFYQFGLGQHTRDSLRFYVNDPVKGQVTAVVPSGWENNWHHLAGIYDGKILLLYIDGILAGKRNYTGTVTNKPYPVNIGRNAEIEGQEYNGRTSNARFDHVSIYSKAMDIKDLMEMDPLLRSQSELWLDFDEVLDQGTFYSMGTGGRTYGMIWPDRTPQPEMWQVKKSAQPVKTTWIDPASGTVEIWNRHHFTNLSERKCSWQLKEDDDILEQGTLDLTLAPLERKTARIPFNKPILKPGKEYRLLIRYELKESTTWAKEGFEVAWDELELPWNAGPVAIQPDKQTKPQVTREESEILITGNNFAYKVSLLTGQLTSMVYRNSQLIQSGPVLNVWRAPLANELDQWAVGRSDLSYRKPGMGADAANNWRSLGLDHITHTLQDIRISEESGQEVILDIYIHSEGINYNTAFDNHFRYIISGNGMINLRHEVTPQGLMPAWLPRIGNQWVLDNALKNISWYGKGPFENYPDRKTGAKTGIYHSTLGGMKEPYLTPQDYGLRCDNRWVRLESDEGTGLEFRGDQGFNFNAHPYSPDNLTRARYPYQLQESDGITFNYDYATSGVGCTAISVLNQYRVLPGVYKASVWIRPFTKADKIH